MKKLLLVCLLAVSASSVAGNCNYPDDIAADGSMCGGRAASVRPGGYEPPPEYGYAQPVYVAPRLTPEQQKAQDEMIARMHKQEGEMSKTTGLIVNTGKQRWVCPVTGDPVSVYRTYEGELNAVQPYIIVDGHKWYNQTQNKKAIQNYSNTNLYDFPLFFSVNYDTNEISLADGGNTGSGEVSMACFKYEGGVPAWLHPENQAAASVVASWAKVDKF